MPTTPYSQALDAGIYTLEMPANIVVGADTYLFSNWEDSTTNPVRQIDLSTSISVTAYYSLYIPQQTLSVNSSPVTGITFTLTKVG